MAAPARPLLLRELPLPITDYQPAKIIKYIYLKSHLSKSYEELEALRLLNLNAMQRQMNLTLAHLNTQAHLLL